MSEILLVGEDNPYGSDPAFALYPLPERASGHRLQHLVMGLSRGEYLRRFDRVNLCSGTWNIKEARARATELLLGEWTKYVLCGAKVREAFLKSKCSVGVAKFPVDVHGSQVTKTLVCIPHPSGLCREWGEPGAYDRYRRILREHGVLPALTEVAKS